MVCDMGDKDPLRVCRMEIDQFRVCDREVPVCKCVSCVLWWFVCGVEEIWLDTIVGFTRELEKARSGQNGRQLEM